MTTMAMPRARAAEQEDKKAKKKGRGKKVLAVLLLAVVVLGAASWFFFKPDAGNKEPVAGEVLTLEPVQVNLAAGHYLRVGVALQLVEGAYEVDGSKALDAVISIFSGRNLSEVSTREQREGLRTELTERLELAYEGEVLEVYFTEFVTQ